MASQQLTQAYRLIKSGQKAQAAAQLRDFLDLEADNPDAWWLLANAATDPADIREALERNLALRPDHAMGQKALAAFNRKYPPPAATADDDDDFDMLFSDEFVDQPRSAPAAKYARKPAQKKNNQTWILYGSLAVIVLLVCGGIAAVVMEATRVVSDVVNSEEFAGMQAMVAEMGGYESVPQDARQMGNISAGERKTATVDTFDDDVWTFEGRAGQVVTIELNATDDALDPQLYLFHPSGHLVDANDDYGPGLDSRIRHTLTANGRYSIVVSAFGSGGDYELLLYE